MDATEPVSSKDVHLDAPTPGDDATIEITIKFPPEKHHQPWTFTPTDTFDDLIQSLSLEFPSYDWSKAKALPEKRSPGLKALYTPASDAAVALSALHRATLRILAPQTTALATLSAQRDAAAAWQAKRRAAHARYARPASSLARHRPPSAEDQTYTFHALRPLPHLPHASRSLAFLERLRADPGIRAVMRAHRFRVGVLAEMDPASHTAASRDGSAVTRILGLNRNRGEAIELRLRTDAYDGWRDYRVIRKTLCHELAHNVHSDHDADFWALCRRIEREVERADWRSRGRTLGDEEYAPARGGGEEEEVELGEGEVMDHGGWEGGTYVLGGGDGGSQGLSERELRARAAEARWSNLERAAKQSGDGSGGSKDEGSQ